MDQGPPLADYNRISILRLMNRGKVIYRLSRNDGIPPSLMDIFLRSNVII